MIVLQRRARKQRRRKSRANGMNQDAVEEYRQRERSTACRREWYDDVVHHKIGGDAVQHAEQDRVPNEDGRAATRQEVHGDDRERNGDVQHRADMKAVTARLPLTIAGALIFGTCVRAPRMPNDLDVLPGIEVLLADLPAPLSGKRVGLITNHTGIDRQGRRTIDLLAARRDVKLVTLFAFEHGLGGQAPPGEKIASTVDEATGLPVHSLYGAVRKPTAEMLAGLDALLYDVQDVGARPYTRVSTMALSMQAAAEAGIPFVVLDRPNPLGGVSMEGPVLEEAHASFVGMYPIPLRHGMTVGELARMYNVEFGIGATLIVVPVRGWRRAMWFDETGLPWVGPSPNIRTLEAALLYPGMVMIEGTNLSEGRGTDLPFEQVGAPWLDAPAVVRAMRARDLPGLDFQAVDVAVRPGDDKHAGQTIHAVRLVVRDRARAEPVRTALALLETIRAVHPAEFRWGPTIDRLAGTTRVRAAVDSGSVDALLREMTAAVDAFRLRRGPYLIY